YETVGDIHQLQRSAELAGLLKLRSHERISGIMSYSQRRRLIALQERFAEDDTFVDDFSMPDETHLYQRSVSNPSAADEPIVTLNDSGIDVQSEGFFGWDQIQDERIARVSYTKRIFLPGMRIPAGSSALFRFEFPSGRIEIPLASLNVTIWELD